jgi:energy-coupling factor transporter ATP-binding protein EcfA2
MLRIDSFKVSTAKRFCSMTEMLYLIGQPGSGKTTLIESLTEGELGAVVRKPFAHTVYDRIGVVQLGAQRDGGFGGTDALGMAVQPVVLNWLPTCGYDYVLAEGDRLANDKFFNAVTDMGWNLCVAWIDLPDSVAVQRRAARGSNQNETWLKGRVTKVDKLSRKWGLKRIDGTMTTATQLSELKWLPVSRRFFE